MSFVERLWKYDIRYDGSTMIMFNGYTNVSKTTQRTSRNESDVRGGGGYDGQLNLTPNTPW